MSAAEQVALDALHECGIEGVTLWQIRCLSVFRACVMHLGVAKFTEYDTPRVHAETRYRSDVCAGSLGELHRLAQWDDAEWMARRSGVRRPLPAEPERFQEALF